MHRQERGDFSLATLRRHYIDPHGFYNALRAYDSIYFDSSSQCWLVTSHAAITTILTDARFSSALGASAAITMPSIRKQMLFIDGEAHLRTQNVMLRPLAYLAKKIPDDIKKFTRMALAEVQSRGEMDLVKDFASIVSLLTIAYVLGIPSDNRAELFQLEKWSDTFGDITSGYFHGDIKDIERLENYFRQLISIKRDHPTNDLLCSFIEASDVFPEEELIANCMMVFTAGRVTSKKLIGNSASFLFQHWKQYQQEFRTDPRTMTKLLGEETLRVITPTRYLMRQATEDIDLSLQFPGKHLLRKGERTLLFLEAANYDPAIFAQPELFDPHRHPNKHIAFGYGNHQCPGAAIGRLEIQIALEALLSLSEFYLKPHTIPVWNPNPNLGGYASCPVHFRF